MSDNLVSGQKPGSTPLLLASSPHIASPVDTTSLMSNVLIALAPASIFGVLIYGMPALLNIGVSVLGAVIAEGFFRLLTNQDVRDKDLSAVVTGLLLALVIPPTTPIWMTLLGAIFAVVVAKEFFGGLGANMFNPALIGRAFLFTSFSVIGGPWAKASAQAFIADAATGPTPLSKMATYSMDGANNVFATFSGGSAAGYWQSMKTLFFGYHGGCTGETSVLLILAGLIFLLVTKTIDWRVPVAMCGGAAILAYFLGIDPLFTVLSGGLVFGAVFMATDYVTAPVTPNGKLLFGLGAGILTVLIRQFGNLPEGVSYAILIMNAFTPFLNKMLPRKYGFVKKTNKEAAK